MLILRKPFEQWTDLKNDLANYPLNSSILLAQPPVFELAHPLYGVREGVSRQGLLPEIHEGEIWQSIVDFNWSLPRIDGHG